MKNSIQDSAIGWSTDAPEDWQPRVIKRDFEVVLGKMLQSAQASPDETEEKYLRSANLGWDNADLSDVKTMWFSPQEKARLHLQYGDLLASEGGDVGRTSFWRDEIAECYYQNAINRIRNRQSDSTRFLYYWLYFLKHVGFVDAVVSRITIPHLTAEKLEGLPYLRPPFAEQQRIVAYLDKACVAIDGAIRAKRQQLEVLDNLRKSIIHKAVTCGLNEKAELRDSGSDYLGQVPKRWKVVHLKRVCSRIQTGTTPPTDNPDYYEEGSVPWYSPGSYNEDIRLGSPSKLINEKAIKDRVLRIFPANTVFLVGIGATIGKVGITISDASCNQQITGIVCLPCVVPFFLSYQLKIYEQIIPNIAQFTTLPIMDQARIGNLQVVVPPLGEQKKIASFLDRKMEEMAGLKSNLLNQIATLEQYRKSLIHECVTGKRRIE